jgi:hypothetical protein
LKNTLQTYNILKEPRTHNVIADAISRLDMEETPFEDTKESFLGLMECVLLKYLMYRISIPSTINNLKIAQDKDKTLQKILKMEKTIYAKGI